MRKEKIEEDGRLIYDILGNIVVIELIEDDNETIESDNGLEMMEDEVSSATSPTPFARNQLKEVRQNRGGNLPRPQAHYENRPNQSYYKSIDYRPKGRPYPIEKPYKFQGQALGQILNIAAHDPQLWNSVIDIWKYPVVAEVWKNIPQETNPETMYKYLETFLEESTRALWESYKSKFKEHYNTMLSLGANIPFCKPD